MKRRVLKFPVCAAFCLLLTLGRASGSFSAGQSPSAAEAAPIADASPGLDTPPPLGAATPTGPTGPSGPTAPAAVEDTPIKPGKKGKSGSIPKVRPQKDILFPLPVGETASHTKIPELGLAGQLLSQMNAAQMKRVDNEHVEMHELKIDLYHPDGKEDFHILLPNSVFNLKTRIITSTEPVTVKTDDFELTGERMEFNTVDRTGKLLGHVSMHIHNLKQVAAVPDATPAPQ